MVQQTHTLDVNDSKALNQLLQREKHITNIIRLDCFGLLFVAHGIFSFIPQLLIVAVIVISHISLVEHGPHNMYVLCECFEFFLLLLFFFLFFSGMILHLCFCIFCYQYTEFNHLFKANSFFLSSFYSRSKS